MTFFCCLLSRLIWRGRSVCGGSLDEIKYISRMRCVCALFSCQKTPPFWNYSLFFLLWAISVNSLLSLQPNTHTHTKPPTHTHYANSITDTVNDVIFFVGFSLTFKAARELGCGAFFAACFLILFAVFILKYKTKKTSENLASSFQREMRLTTTTRRSLTVLFFSLSLSTGLGYILLSQAVSRAHTHTHEKQRDVTYAY